MAAPTENVQIEASWKKALDKEFSQPYFAGIKEFLLQERAAGSALELRRRPATRSPDHPDQKQLSKTV